MMRWLYLAVGVALGGALIGAVIATGGDIGDVLEADDVIESTTADGSGVSVTLVEEHNADRVAIRHEYDQSYDNRIVLGVPEVQDAPRFGGTVTFSSTREWGQSVFCTSQYPTHDFVVAAIDEQTVDGGGVTWEVLDRQTIEVPLRQIGC